MRMEIIWRVSSIVMMMDATIIKNKKQEEINMKILVNLGFTHLSLPQWQ